MTANIMSRALSKRGPGNASANFQHEERCGSILSKKSAACFVRLRSGANTIAERVKVESNGGDGERRRTPNYRDGNNLLGAILTLLRADEPDNRVIRDLRMAK